MGDTRGDPGDKSIPILKQRLKNHVSYLTSIQPARTYPNASSLAKAAEYIRQQFLHCSGRVAEQPFEVRGETYKNITILFGSAEKGRFVVGAHYDVCGGQPGADDNASGVAVILELARLIKESKLPLKDRSIELAAFALEEPPWFRTPNMGSAVHANSLAKKKAAVNLMISVDMVGWFARERGRQLNANIRLHPTVEKPAVTTAVVGLEASRPLIKKTWRLLQRGSDLQFAYAAVPRHTPTIDFSDHLNYWNHHYPALLISNCFVTLNPSYHSPADTIESLDFTNMALLTHSLLYTLKHF
jgi:Zn-dependent M28 family amino/carboxypeptidase